MSAAPKIQNPARKKPNSTAPTMLLLLAGGALAVAAMILFASMSPSTGEGSIPTFSASTITGDPVVLSDYRGQVVMLNFWATWCPPCRAEMPAIARAYSEYRDQGFVVIAINNGETVSQITPFVQQLRLPFPVVLDTDVRLQNQFAITGYPTSLFIGRNGEVYASHVGGVTESQLNNYIEIGLDQPAT